jgi:pimeloyl-ACP methyl ester carboxylesterase
MSPQPHVRRAGSGPGLVCLHANASTSGQWRELMERLSDRYRVLAPDLHGAGKSPDWPSRAEIALRDEARFIAPVLAEAGVPYTLVGHSYGAAVALRVALDAPERVRAIAVYEPTLFGLVDQETPPPNDADGIRRAVAEGALLADAGDLDGAAERFIDYWMVPGSWRATPSGRQGPIRESIANIRRWGHALLSEPATLDDFRRLQVPVLLMTGAHSTPSAHAVVRLLGSALPRVTVLRFEELGHMGPVAHPGPVNAAIDAFHRAIRD